MRQQQHRRSKNRGNQNRKGQNPLSRVFDSSGPGIKVRGNAQHVYEKYMALARDAQTAGDYVVYENFAQHGEHYKRIIIEATPEIVEPTIMEENDTQLDTENASLTTADEGAVPEKSRNIRKKPNKNASTEPNIDEAEKSEKKPSNRRPRKAKPEVPAETVLEATI